MRFNVVYLSLLILLLSSCAQVGPLEVRSVTCCELKKAMRSETEVTFSLEIHNPNPFPITIKKYDLEVRLNGNGLGNVANSEATYLPANATIEKAVSVVASSKKLMSGTLIMGLNALLKDDPTTLEVGIVGCVVGSAKGVSKRVRIRETYPIQMHP